MKKFAQKLTKIMLVGALALGGIVAADAIQPSKAEAALGATAIKMNSQFAYGGTAYIHTSQDNYNIYATYEAAMDSYVYVRLTTQVYENGTWRSVETKSGYASKEWGSTKNLNVTFSNYSTAGTRTFRIKVAIYNGWSTSQLMQTAYSATWTR